MYKVNYKGYEFNITQNEDGSFNIPEDIRDIEPFGTALKPAAEYIVLARKPLSEKSVAENVLKWGTGGINIDGSRIGFTSEADKQSAKPGSLNATGENSMFGLKSGNEQNEEGRFPANIILECICDEVIKGEKGEVIEHNGTGGIWNEGTKEPVGRTYNDKGDIHTNPMCPCYMLDEQSGISKSSANQNYKWDNTNCEGNTFQSRGKYTPRDDKGGASRYFFNVKQTEEEFVRFQYIPKVSKKERNMGLDHFEEKETKGSIGLHSVGGTPTKDNNRIQKNTHPTVKPVQLMAYLCRLITPKNGIVLDPYMGSGSTGISALLEGFRFVGMEMDEDYFKIAESRIENYEDYRKLLKK